MLKRTTILRCVLNNKDAIILISRPTRMKKKNNNNETKKLHFCLSFSGTTTGLLSSDETKTAFCRSPLRRRQKYYEYFQLYTDTIPTLQAAFTVQNRFRILLNYHYKFIAVHSVYIIYNMYI